MTQINILAANTTQINRALPFLANAYGQMELFAAQLNTAIEDTATDPTTLGEMPVTYTQSGLDPLAPPANTQYLKWEIILEWNNPDLVWAITSIRKTCTNTTDTTL